MTVDIFLEPQVGNGTPDKDITPSLPNQCEVTRCDDKEEM